MSRLFRPLSILVCMLLLTTMALPTTTSHAAPPGFLFDQSTFFQVCQPYACFDAVYDNPNNEVAEEVLFTGTRRITSVTYAFGTGVEGLTATLRFYEVNPTTGGPGRLVASFDDTGLQAAAPFVRVFNIPTNKQFDWTATPGIYGDSNAQGGFVSLQVRRNDGQPFAWGQGGVALANGASNSLPNFFDVTLNKRTAIENNPGIYFQIGDQNTPAPAELVSLTLNPTRVRATRSSTGTVTLSAPAPAGGAKIELRSNTTTVAQVPYGGVTIPEGQTSATFTVSTFQPGQRSVDVVISATYRGPAQTATLTVTRR